MLAHPDVIGRPSVRIDGPLKVSGAARYAADFMLPDMLHAVPVCATIAHGRITGLDAEAAEAMPGVHVVIHHGNRPPLALSRRQRHDRRGPSTAG